MIHSEIFYLFLIVTAGYIIGNIKIKGFSLDISAILIVALIAGHFGVTIPNDFKFFGLAIFIYAVGLQSGPGFFDVIKQEGVQLNLLATAILILIFGFIYISGFLLKIPKDVVVGVFTGAISSAPALAAALEINNSPSTSIAFGVVYPFGIITTVLFLRFLPSIFKIDLQKELQKYEEHQKSLHPDIITKNFKITNENFKNKIIYKSQVEQMTLTVIERVESDYEIEPEKSDAILHYGDIVRVSGTPQQLENLKIILGEEIEESHKFHDDMKVLRLLVTSKDIVGKKIAELKELRSLHAIITRVRRSGIDIPPYPTLTLRLGDKLYVVAPEKYNSKIKNLIGDNLLKYPAADFLPISLGIVVGIFVGSIPFGLPGIGFVKLSFVGGILITALILGRLGRTGNIVWQLSPHSNSIMKTLGQLIFLATIGTNSGKYLVESVKLHGFLSIYISIASIIASLFLVAFFCTKVLKMNFLDIIGLLSGSMTSTPSLTMSHNMTKSDYPSVSYAAVYPFALVLSIILAQLMIKF
jgi:putative transport protein